MNQTQMKLNPDVAIVSLSNDFAKLAREKAILQSQLYECQQTIKQLQQELETLKEDKATNISNSKK